MIPRIAQRGSSFKGAGLYYFHDKKSETKNRVAWTHVHNLPTDDPELAMRWMAYTAMNRDRLKQEAGIAPTGRKGINKPVYSFSLAWQPEQQPQKQHMLNLAFDALNLLGLKDHEAVFVAHNDTAHPHVHVITNLVHPQTGKTLRPQNDRLRFSAWAEAYEKEHGKIYCEERVVNNERRRRGNKVKHREVIVDNSLIIQNLYNQSDSGKAFEAALKDAGYTLAKGDRRGFVLVDQHGQISSLSRQLKGQRASDLNKRLADLKDLPNAKRIAEERTPKAVDNNEPKNRQSFAEELDKTRLNELNKKNQMLKKESDLREYYKRNECLKKVNNLKEELAKARTKSAKKRLQEELNMQMKGLADIDRRMREQGIDPEDAAIKDFSVNSGVQKTQQISPKGGPEQETEDEYKARMRKYFEEKRSRSKGRGPSGPDGP